MKSTPSCPGTTLNNGLSLPLTEKAVKVTLELPASLHRDLAAYAELLGRQTGQPVRDPAQLIVPMLERFIATDRGFAKMRREKQVSETGS